MDGYKWTFCQHEGLVEYLKVVQDKNCGVQGIFCCTGLSYMLSVRCPSYPLNYCDNRKNCPHKFRICLLDGRATWVKNLCLKHFKKIQKYKRSPKNKDLQHFRSEAHSAMMLLSSEARGEFLLWFFFSRLRYVFCLHLAVISLHYLPGIPVVDTFLRPLCSLSLTTFWEGYISLGSEGDMKNKFESIQENQMEAFYLSCGKFT